MKTILVVDDEYAIASVLTNVLEDEGYRVITAPNGKAGLEHLEKPDGIDLVLLDVMMPVLDGREMLRQLRLHKRHAGVPVIMMSAAPRIMESVNKAVEPQFQEFLAKPFQLETLLAAVQRLIGDGT